MNTSQKEGEVYAEAFISLKLVLENVPSVIDVLSADERTEELGEKLNDAYRKMLSGTYSIQRKFWGVVDVKFNAPVGNRETISGELVKLYNAKGPHEEYDMVMIEG